jgi:hypothetical protein
MPTEDTESIEDSWKISRPDRNTDYADTETVGEPERAQEFEDPVAVTNLLPTEPYERSVIWVGFLWQGQEIPGGRTRVQLPDLMISNSETHPEGEFLVEGTFRPPRDCFIDSMNLYLCERGGPSVDRNRNPNIVFQVSHDRGLAFSFVLRRNMNASNLRILVLG